MKFLIVIPAYNEARKIKEVIEDIKKNGFEDILVVDDASKDDTFKLASSCGINVLKHEINRGQGASIKTGVAFADKYGYEAVVFFDADGQMKSKEIFNFIKTLENGYDVVLGSRNLGQAVDIPFIKKIIKKMALIFTLMTTGLKITDTHNGFQAWRVSVLKKINWHQDRFAYASELLNEIAEKKLKYIELPVVIEYTDYSKAKGQKISGLFRILWDLLIK